MGVRKRQKKVSGMSYVFSNLLKDRDIISSGVKFWAELWTEQKRYSLIEVQVGGTLEVPWALLKHKGEWSETRKPPVNGAGV